MSDDYRSNLVSTFMEITGVDLQKATFALEASAFDLESAVNLHMSGSIGGAGDSSEEINFASSARLSAGDDKGLKRSASNASSFVSALDNDGVRKADEVKRQRLIDTPSKGMRHDASLPSNVKESVFFTSSDDRLTGKAKELNKMFAPPREIMVTQPLNVVKEMCGEEKWLFVNIQRVDEFNCLTLNRDVWADEMVKEVIRSSFLFWQQMHTDFDLSNHMHRKTDAQDFVQKYHVNIFPHLSILDPRTGAMIWRWDDHKLSTQKRNGDTEVKKEHLMERLMDFLGDYPCPKDFIGKKPAPAKDARSKSMESLLSQETVIAALRPGDDNKPIFAPSFSESRTSSITGTKIDEILPVTQSETGATHVQPDIKGQGFRISRALSFGKGVDSMDESRMIAGGSMKIKLQLLGSAAMLSLAEDATALELVMFIAKRLTDGPLAKSASNVGDETGTMQSPNYELERRFEVSFGMPVVRLSQVVGEDQKQLESTTLASLGLKRGDLVRLQLLAS